MSQFRYNLGMCMYVCVCVWFEGVGWVPPYVVQFCWFPHVIGCPPVTGRPLPLYLTVCSTHHLSESTPSVGFPFLPHSIQRGELHQIFTMYPPQQMLCNAIQSHYKMAFFNMFQQSNSWHTMFCSLTVFRN